MAVKENVRKRKHKNTENQTEDNDEDEVPKKVAKKHKSPKKAKTKEQHVLVAAAVDEAEQEASALAVTEEKEDMEVVATSAVEQQQVGDETAGSSPVTEALDSGFEDATNTKFPSDFKMLHFRTKLRGNDFITELRHFLHVCQTRPKMVAKYMEKRGKPLELAEAFERIDKANVLHVAYLSEALQLVLMEIVTNQKAHMESAEHASRYFLKTHGVALNSLLNSTQLRHRCVALKLLTAMVCVEPQLGRQLLSAYDILSNTKTIEKFLSHPKFEPQAAAAVAVAAATKRAAAEETTVRKCFIHFVLAFLVDGNVLLTRNILDRPALLHGLTGGLLYDDHVTVCVVLNTLKKYVLECADISKTKKIHVFDHTCCKHVSQLYDWRGPDVLKHVLQKRDAASNRELNSLVDAEQRDAVAAAAHEFLLMLLTSRKHGINFDAIAHFRQKHNTIQGKVISSLYRPWLDERKSDLILKVLAACPDVARLAMRSFGGIVNVMRTPPREWVQACGMLAAMIDALHPRLLRGAIAKMTLTDFTYWIKDTCLPLETLVLLNGAKMLRHTSTECRIATSRLLLAMFRQYANYMAVVRRREAARGGDNAMRRFKFDILNHILANFPSVDNVFYALYLTTQAQEAEEAQVLRHLDVTLDLVLAICAENRSFVNKTNTILDYLTLLRPLYAGGAQHTHIRLELKAVQTILTLVPKALQPGEPLFASVLDSFAKAYVHGAPALQREAGGLLRGLLANTGLFAASEYEADLWLEPLRHCSDDAADAAGDETLQLVTCVFVEVLQVVNAPVALPKAAASANVRGLRQLFGNIERGHTVQAHIEPLAISKLLPLILKGVELVPPLRRYLEAVGLLLLHYYPEPDVVRQLCQAHLPQLAGYMDAWLAPAGAGGGRPIEFPADVLSVPHLAQVYAHVVSGGGGAQEQLSALLFPAEAAAQPHARAYLLYVQLAMFLVAQLHAQRRLTAGQAERAASLISGCLQHVQRLDAPAEEEGEEFASAADEAPDSVLAAMLKYVFGLRLAYMPPVQLFRGAQGEEASELSYMRFLRQLAAHCRAYAHFERHSANCRLKLVQSTALLLHELRAEQQDGHALTGAAADSAACRESLALLDAYALQPEDCAALLRAFADSQLRAEHLFVGAARTASAGHELLVHVLRRANALHAHPGEGGAACTTRLVDVYATAAERYGAEAQLEPLEEALHDYLLVAHQHLPLLRAACFAQFFGARKLGKASVRLACLLLARVDNFDAVCVQELPGALDRKELHYPLLDVALRRALPLPAAHLQAAYQAYKAGFLKTAEKPQKGAAIYREHVACSVALVQRCMPPSECVDFSRRQLKLDGASEPYQLRLLAAIYGQAVRSLRQQPDAGAQHALTFGNFVLLLVQLLGLDLKRGTLTTDKLRLCAHLLQRWWEEDAEQEEEQRRAVDFDGGRVVQSAHWTAYAKATLKAALQPAAHDADAEAEDASGGAGDAYGGLLLQLLAYLSERLLPADGDAAAQLFEMACTHSRCHELLLQPPAALRGASAVKTQLLHLLFVLGRKCPGALRQLEIPVVLGAYQARLGASDRYALALLQLYERHDAAALAPYRPFIWGESAVAFYALRGGEEERARLQQHETSVAQVMALIDRQLCDYTLANYPIWRRLAAAEQLPAVHFAAPDAPLTLQAAANSLERRIEAGERDFAEAELRVCPKRDALQERCYDPAFMVPLMSMCFAPEAYAHAARPVQNGLLALTFAALSAQDRDLRLAAACVQQRYRAHFAQRHFYERPLWLQAYENLQAGLHDLRESWLRHNRRNSGTPRVPYIPGLFVARTLNVLAEPTHTLYAQLTMYLRLKSSFNFECVPEFNRLFYAAEVEQHAQRHFIVEVIRDGIKCSSDLFLLVSTNVFKVLLGFYGSAASTLDTNLLILSVLSTCVKIPAATKLVVEHVGVLPWLSSVVSTLQFHHFDIIEGLITIYNNLWYALTAYQAHFHNYAHLSLELHRQLLALAPHLSARISAAHFARFLNILQKTATAGTHSAMSGTQLDHLINCSELHYPTLVHGVQSIRRFGGDGAASQEAYCSQLGAAGADATAALTLTSLRAYTMEWWRAHRSELAASNKS